MSANEIPGRGAQEVFPEIHTAQTFTCVMNSAAVDEDLWFEMLPANELFRVARLLTIGTIFGQLHMYA